MREFVTSARNVDIDKFENPVPLNETIDRLEKKQQHKSFNY